ncbi:hypothetical protein Q8F55_009202 [Vanrija albida]|uniref:Uncharacterized protein n=1 Tax=Vanrija albida TaxID=181172 RepID=A0ABR3PSZ8_9TREE
MSLPEYTPVPTYPPGEASSSTARQPMSAPARPADPGLQLFPRAFLPIMLRALVSIVGLGVPVILVLHHNGVATLPRLAGYLLVFAASLCAAAVSARAFFVLMGPALAMGVLFGLMVASFLAVALDYPQRGGPALFHPAWIALGAAAALAGAVIVRVLSLTSSAGARPTRGDDGESGLLPPTLEYDAALDVVQNAEGADERERLGLGVTVSLAIAQMEHRCARQCAVLLAYAEDEMLSESARADILAKGAELQGDVADKAAALRRAAPQRPVGVIPGSPRPEKAVV